MPSMGIRYAARSVPEPDRSERFVDRLSRQGEEALGRLAEELLANPVVNSALTRTLEAREKAVQAQEAALGALNIPSTADVERMTRRLRSISQRLEEVEDGVDKLGTKLETMTEASRAPATRLSEQLERVESRLDQLARDLAAIRADAGSGGGLAGEPPAVVG